MDYEEEKKDATTAEIVSIASQNSGVVDSDDELDPVMLKKAFRFAAWSSIILVSYIVIPLRQMIDSDLLTSS